MKVNVIKKLAETESVEHLKLAEEAILNGEPLSISVDGEDEGEQLTHVSAALWVKEYSEKEQVDIKDAVRKYTQRVRGSLG